MQLLATPAASPTASADVLAALRPRGTEAAGGTVPEGKTTMLLPRYLYDTRTSRSIICVLNTAVLASSVDGVAHDRGTRTALCTHT